MKLFEGFIGHASQCAYLERVASQGALAHAYVFSGPAHVGKTLVAERLTSNATDVLHIRRPVDEKTERQKTTIPVDTIRQVRAHMQLSSFDGGKKVVIIHDADTMTTAAQNALLKTLEEPRGNSLIILLATNEEKLLPTIQSRSVLIRYRPVPREVICKALQTHTSQERAHTIAGYAAGRPGFALTLLDRDQQKQFEDRLLAAESFLASSMASRIQQIGSLTKEDRSSVTETMEAWRHVVHECLLISTDNEHQTRQSDTIESLARKKRPSVWAAALDQLSHAEQAIEKNVQSQLALESFAISLDI